jgi:hypothetical protein
MGTVRIYTSLILNPTYHYLYGSNMNLTAVLFWKIKTTPSPWPPVWIRRHQGLELQSSIGHVAVCDRWRTMRSWRTGLLCMWGVTCEIFVLSRPPISCRYRCTSDSLPAFSLENFTGHKLTNWLYRPVSDIKIGPRWEICAKLRLCLSPQNCIPVQISNTQIFSVYGLRPSSPIVQQTKHFGSRFGYRNILFPFEHHQAMPAVQKPSKRKCNIKLPETPGNDLMKRYTMSILSSFRSKMRRWPFFLLPGFRIFYLNDLHTLEWLYAESRV